MKIGVLGSIAIDNIFEAKNLPGKGERVFGKLLGSFVGGIGANQAMELSRFLPDVFFLGQLNKNDPAGQKVLRGLREKNVKLDKIIYTEVPTGQTYMYLIDNQSDYFSMVTQGANNCDVDTQIIESVLDGLDAVLVSLEINVPLAFETLKRAKKRGLKIWFSPSPAENCSKEMLELADSVILNEREGSLLLGIHGESVEEIKKSLSDFDSPYEKLLVSLGSKGALLKTKNEVIFAPALDVVAVDSVGAGDALAGAFIAALYNGYSDYEALCFGCIAGSLTVAIEGAQTSDHNLEILTDIYNKHYKR